MRRILLLPILALLAVFFVAAPANAATVDSFTITEVGTDPTDPANSLDGETVPVGTAVDLIYSTTIADGGTVTRTGGGTGVPGFDDDDAEDQFQLGGVTLDEAGTYTLTVAATDADGPDEASVTITVSDETTEIPAPEVTFPDQCTVVLPDAENVSYGVGTGQSGSDVAPGTYDLADFYNFGAPITFGVNPDPGFSFPDDAQTVFEVTPSEDCFPVLIEAEAICQAVEFTNTTEDTLLVQYGDRDEVSPDDEFELAAGTSRTVSSERDLVFFLAAEDDESDILQAGLVDVEQDCTPAAAGASFPTVAPAAGADSASSAGTSAGATGALAIAALIGTGLLGLRRLRSVRAA